MTKHGSQYCVFFTLWIYVIINSHNFFHLDCLYEYPPNIIRKTRLVTPPMISQFSHDKSLVKLLDMGQFPSLFQICEIIIFIYQNLQLNHWFVRDFLVTKNWTNLSSGPRCKHETCNVLSHIIISIFHKNVTSMKLYV